MVIFIWTYQNMIFFLFINCKKEKKWILETQNCFSKFLLLFYKLKIVCWNDLLQIDIVDIIWKSQTQILFWNLWLWIYTALNHKLCFTCTDDILQTLKKKAKTQAALTPWQARYGRLNYSKHIYLNKHIFVNSKHKPPLEFNNCY